MRIHHSLAARPTLVDTAVAAVFVTAAELEAAFEAVSVPRWLDGLVALGFTAPLAWRRRRPVAVLATMVAAVLVYGVIEQEGAHQTLVPALAFASFTAGYEAREELRWAAPAVVVAGLAIAAATGYLGGDLVFALVIYVGPWALARALRTRGRRLEELSAGVARVEEQATAAERARIARELHDVVSHSISVIAVQTQAIRRRLGAEHAREIDELMALETTARQAMGEMRRLLGVLRADEDRLPLAPQPGLDQLPRLLERTRAAGLSVELRVEGEATPLPPGLDLAAYRVVQEALTNVLRHAGRATARVVLRYGADAVEVEVADDGRGPASSLRGHGLVGMRERVALYGGTLVVGAGERAGYRVLARLPVRDGAG